MYAAFVRLLNMSAAAGILIAVVCLLRLVLKRVPKKYICVLWGIVALRLMLPFSISSALSAFNYLGAPRQVSGQVEYIQYNGKTEKPKAEISLPVAVSQMEAEAPEVRKVDAYLPTLMGIGAVGMGAMLIYSAVSYGSVRRRTRGSILLGRNVFLCDTIPSPFILGVFRPHIYIPSDLSKEQISSVVAHERAHISRRDHLWKPIGFVLLSIHWFNPMVWLAYGLLCRDIEMACDEKVIANMTGTQKQTYSAVLLSCSLPRRFITACPLAFGEVGVKQRIRGILNYKKPTFWVVAAATVICLIVGAVFLTNPLRQGDYLLLKKEQNKYGGQPKTADFAIRMGDKVNKAMLYTQLWENGVCTQSIPFLVPEGVEKIRLNLSGQEAEDLFQNFTIQITTDQKEVFFSTTLDLPDNMALAYVPAWFGEKEVPLNEDSSILLSSLIFSHGKDFFLFDFDNANFTDPFRQMKNIECAILICAEFEKTVPWNPDYDSYWDTLREKGFLKQEGGHEVFDFVMPADFCDAQIREELHKWEGIEYRSAEALPDGSVRYCETREDYDRSIRQLIERMESMCQGMPNSYHYNAAMSSVAHNQDFTEFTVTVKDGIISGFDTDEVNDRISYFAQLFSLYTTGEMNREITIRYQDKQGNPARQITPNYRLKNGNDRVATIWVDCGEEVHGYGTSYGIGYHVRETRSLPCLDGMDNLKSIVITARDLDDQILWSHRFSGDEKFPLEDDGWTLIQNSEWVKINTPSEIRHLTQATITLDDREIAMDLQQTAQLEGILCNAQKLETASPLLNQMDAILQVIQEDGRYRSISLATDGSSIFRWGEEFYKYEDETGLIDSLLHPSAIPEALLTFLRPVRVDWQDNTLIDKVSFGKQVTLEELLASDRWVEQPIPETVSGPGFIYRGYLIEAENGNTLVVRYDSDNLCIYSRIGKCLGCYRGSYTGEQMVDMLWNWAVSKIGIDLGTVSDLTLTQTEPQGMLSILMHPTNILNIDGMGALTPENQEEWISAWNTVLTSDKTVSKDANAESYYGVILHYGYTYLSVHNDGTGLSLREMGGERRCYLAKNSKPLIELLSPILRQFHYSHVTPSQLKEIQYANLVYDGMQYTIFQGDPKLSQLESILASGTPIGFMSACPFTSLLTVGLPSGATKTVSVATDSCGVYLSNGVCYEFSGDNAQLYQLFGIDLTALLKN